MSDTPVERPVESEDTLDEGTYEILRKRLESQSSSLKNQVEQLNSKRKEIFGRTDSELIGTERVTTSHNCVPRDIINIGSKVLFGYNVHIGLKSEILTSDVFSVYEFSEAKFNESNLEMISDQRFINDFNSLYKYYKKTRFAKFALRSPYLYMVFQTGKAASDIKTFKWLVKDDVLEYVDNRSDHEFQFPIQHDFEWTRTHRDLHRTGTHPHVSIEDRLFVETVGGDLTIKVEDNTDSGKGIYQEPVEEEDQTLDDADIFYAIVGNIILLKILPYQEKEHRYIAYNEKVQLAMNIPSIEQSCVLLPEDQGLIFPDGTFLQNGEHKRFDSSFQEPVFEKKLQAPNGEDFLYIYYQPSDGTYQLLPYNIIEQNIDTPIVCHGYTILPNGSLIYFKAHDDASRHHALQIWKTPFCDINQVEAPSNDDSKLFKIGNKDIVRFMAECYEIIGYIHKGETFSGAYLEIAKRCSTLVDRYFWLDSPEVFGVGDSLRLIGASAQTAVEEFDKVVQTKKASAKALLELESQTEDLLRKVRASLDKIEDFVAYLSQLRQIRGEVISLKELKYMDLARVDELEKEISESNENLSLKLAEFLQREGSLTPYEQQVTEQDERIATVKKTTEANEIQEALDAASKELEMLIDIVSNLKLEDPTQSTKIIDDISTIYTTLNQSRASLKQKRHSLLSVEGKAKFYAQMRLLDQSLSHYLDICDTEEKCQEYLSKSMVSLDELESQFVDFDEFLVEISEKREKIHGIFEAKKLECQEAKQRKAGSLFKAAERILQGVIHRLKQFKTIEEINGFFAGDLMIDKVRDQIEQLTNIGDTTKADDLQSRLKSSKEEAVRVLKDKLDLFTDGDNVIQFGQRKFSVNRQELELSMVMRDDEMNFHLSGTNFFEAVSSEDLSGNAEIWSMERYSENKQVYRSEFLAYELLNSIDHNSQPSLSEAAAWSYDEMLEWMREQLNTRLQEGYVKGVHDHDAVLILSELLKMKLGMGLLAVPPKERALAHLFWRLLPEDQRSDFSRSAHNLHLIENTFEILPDQKRLVARFKSLLEDFVQECKVIQVDDLDEVAHYLCDFLKMGHARPVSGESLDWITKFKKFILTHNKEKHFTEQREAFEHEPLIWYSLCREWVNAFLSKEGCEKSEEVLDEVTMAFFLDEKDHVKVDVDLDVKIEKLKGQHGVMEDGTMQLHYHHFLTKLHKFVHEVVPLYQAYLSDKSRLIKQYREDLRLEEFTPRILSSFVRNQLIQEVYLPMIGDNLAKQIGEVGENKRTDLMGLLLIISPPGYGKTTLMEYVADRLGITFVKVNGPAIGHSVTSLDPSEATNSNAAAELHKVNLALEMGDNVMIYLDDIQHLNPEFLQKFISLCDGQRRIEGIYKGRAKTYDLRGKKVAVVMAGNPYTESGDKFKIPDMLANRADTYNLGDILGSSAESFERSYLENSITSNATLRALSSGHREDVLAMIKWAETGKRDGVEFKGKYSNLEQESMLSVMQKLLRVRDVVLKVNQAYIASAAQADEYRTEPPFKLQGSYRNMNKMCEKIVPVMNDQELEHLILSHYESESQTLTSEAEANLLKFKHMIEVANEDEKQRYLDIQKTFQQNLLLGSSGDDGVGKILAQMIQMGDHLGGIQKAIQSHSGGEDRDEASIQDVIAEIKTMSESILEKAKPQDQQIEVVNRIPKSITRLIVEQHKLMGAWMKPVFEASLKQSKELDELKASLDKTASRYKDLLSNLKEPDDD